jgi:antitoxin MazE
MRVRLQKWGNSLAVRIPRSFAAETGMTDRGEIEMSLKEGGIVLRPVRAAAYDLAELVARITPDNRHGEVEAGPGVGGEAW